MSARILIEIKGGLIWDMVANVPVELHIVDWNNSELEPVELEEREVPSIIDEQFAKHLALIKAKIEEENEP